MKKLATIITTVKADNKKVCLLTWANFRAKAPGLGMTIKKALNECLGFALFYPLGFAGQQS